MVLPLPQLPASPPAWRQKKGGLGTLLRANVAENTRYVVFAPTRPVFARDAKRLEWNV
ncbi:Zn-clus domain-containing protein [Pyrenophora tritici-repentis]|nr:Zn-clus domain-containing protein [Pyrenophora tritici-repentis]KAF7451437.1 hypothetical protein A1F99_032140 [Pyrenophora tritici-repentis]